MPAWLLGAIACCLMMSTAMMVARAGVLGFYERGSPLLSQLRVTALKSGALHVSLTRLAKQHSGAVLPGDCQVEATGRLKRGILDAAVVPFNDVNMGADARFLAQHPARVRVTFGRGYAYVEHEDFRGCGQGPTFVGKYIYRSGNALRPGPAETLPPLPRGS